MAELVDAPDLGSGAAKRESSSLSTPIFKIKFLEYKYLRNYIELELIK